ITDTFSTTFSAPNYDFVDQAMEKICTQWLNVKVDGEGSVSGGVTPLQKFTFGLESNNLIACASSGGDGGDCIENLHQAGDGRASQTIDMTATPSDGWHFQEWRSESPKKKCQCDGSGDPSCKVEQPPVGYYSPDDSID